MIAYSYQVKNIGNVDLTSVSVSDPSLGAVSCPIPAAPGLAPGASETCTGETQQIVTAAEQVTGKIADTATATGTDIAGNISPPSAPSTDTVPVGLAMPLAAPTPTLRGQRATTLAVDKHVSRTTAYPGQKFTYTLTVRNDGPATATDVKVTHTWTIALKVISIHSSPTYTPDNPAGRFPASEQGDRSACS